MFHDPDRKKKQKKKSKSQHDRALTRAWKIQDMHNKYAVACFNFNVKDGQSIWRTPIIGSRVI